MNSIIKSSCVLIASGFLSANVQAQSLEKTVLDNPPQTIIINKKDSVKEKITLVIDGNNITVNGKPIDAFTSKDIDIFQQKNDFDNAYAYGDALPPITPLAPKAPQVQAFRDMMRNVKTNNAFLGVMTEQTDKGAKITEVTGKSAAEKAGLKEGDVITKVGDDKITGPNDLYKSVGKHKPDDKVSITYVRDSKTSTANVTLGKSEQVRVYSWNTPGDYNNNYNNDFNQNFSFSWNNNKPRLGISAQDTEDGNGVKILDVDDDDSPAGKAGLKQDDIITQVNGKAITSTDDLRQSVRDIKKGDMVKITYKRNNQSQTVDVKFPKDLKTIDL